MRGKINLISKIRDDLDSKQLGFTLEGSEVWYNIRHSEEILMELLKTSIRKGNIVEFELKDKLVQELRVLQSGPIEAEKNESIINIKGKNFMTYEGLLHKAHGKGEFSMEITGSYVSEDMTKAWCKVRLTAGDQIFDGFGSSTPDNTGAMTMTHPVEMAHTRAKGRALRDYLDIGEVMAEELKQG